MNRASLSRLLFAALLMPAIPPADLRAQTVTGEIVNATDGQPLHGAFVTLLGADGRREAGHVTDGDGRYTLRAHAPGTYTLRVERIGFESVSSESVVLGRDTVHYRFAVPTRAVQLPALVVEAADRGCNRRDDAPQVHALWEEIRKALDVTAWTQAAGVRYTLVQQHRERDLDGLRVYYERRVPHALTSVLPFTAVTAAELVQNGFLRQVQHESILLGVDAHALLSSEFLDVYCFRLLRDNAAGEIGLAFEPATRRSVADIRGVLWLDRASAELRRLEYSYTGLTGDLAAKDAGGAVRFSRLPTGAWIISEWRIHTPILGRQPRGRTTYAIGVREEGGAVLSAQHDGAVVYRLHGSGVIEGSYREPRPGATVAGTLVHLSGTPFVGVADAAGNYRIEGVPPGRYALSFTPSWVTDVRVPVRLDSVTIAAGATVRRDLVGLTEDELVSGVCPHVREARFRPGFVHGTVRDPVSGALLPNVEIMVQWRQGRETVRATVYTNGEGRYVVCGLPRESEISLRLTAGSRRGDAARVVLTGPLLRQDFF